MNLFQLIQPSQTPAHLDKDDSLLVTRDRLLQSLLNFSALAGLIACAAFSIITARAGDWLGFIASTIIWFIIALLTVLRFLSYHLRSTVLIILLFSIAAQQLMTRGLEGAGEGVLFGAVLLAAVLFHWKGVTASFIFGIIIFAVSASYQLSGNIGGSPLPQTDSNTWIITGINLSAIMAISAAATSSFVQLLGQKLFTQQVKLNNLSSENHGLRDNIATQAVELSKRNRSIDVYSRLSDEIIADRSINVILSKAAVLIQHQFGLVRVSIYSPDENSNNLILRSTAGVDREMNESTISLDSDHLVCKAFTIGDQQLNQYTLEPTGSEEQYPVSRLALPLKTGMGLFGVLDLHSNRANPFQDEQMMMFNALAAQIAVIIEKDQLSSRLKSVILETERSARAVIRQTWRSHLAETRRMYSYKYQKSKRETGILTDQIVSPEAGKAMIKGETLVARQQVDPDTGKKVSIVAVPIKVRQEVLGVLDVRFESTGVPQSTLDLLESFSNRLSLALENARLLEAIQLRADREHMVSDISSRVRSSSDIDAILRTAAGELGRSLGIAEVLVQLRQDQ